MTWVEWLGVLWAFVVQSGLLAAIAVAARRWANARMGAESVGVVVRLVGEAVAAAEQLGKVHGLTGKEKLIKATGTARDLLLAYNVSLTDDQLRALIEAAVNKQDLLAPLPLEPVIGELARVTPPPAELASFDPAEYARLREIADILNSAADKADELLNRRPVSSPLSATGVA